MKKSRKQTISKNDKIYLAGHTGLVGSAVLKALKFHGYKKVITSQRKKLNLLDQKKVDNFIFKIKPKAVIICAAKVGGIKANIENKFNFIYENLQIQNNLIYSSHKYNVSKLIFLGSSCIYPAKAKQPIKESYLLNGKLEETNDAYAIAKISGIKMCEALRNQYSRDYVCLMPPNIFGINDNFDLKSSHFIPALIRKIFIAKRKKLTFLDVWGSGKPKREIMSDKDLAEAIVFFLNKKTKESLINVGSGFERTINEYAKILIKISNTKIKIKNNINEKDGVKRKILNSKLAQKYGWKLKYNIISELENVYNFYKVNCKNLKN